MRKTKQKAGLGQYKMGIEGLTDEGLLVGAVRWDLQPHRSLNRSLRQSDTQHFPSQWCRPPGP
jgi:hypothetical protein